MPRFVLKRRAGDALSCKQIRALDGVRVIDQTNDVAVLVEADASTIEQHRSALAGWTIAKETEFPTPAGRDKAR
ncbi:hypothetical protein ACWFZ6_18645 [Methylorubrum extorquens]